MLILHDEQNTHVLRKGRTPQGWDQEVANDVSHASTQILPNFKFWYFVHYWLCLQFFRKNIAVLILIAELLSTPLEFAVEWVRASPSSLALWIGRHLSQGKLEGRSHATHPDMPGSGELSNSCIRKCSCLGSLILRGSFFQLPLVWHIYLIFGQIQLSQTPRW